MDTYAASGHAQQLVQTAAVLAQSSRQQVAQFQHIEVQGLGAQAARKGVFCQRVAVGGVRVAIRRLENGVVSEPR